MAGYEVSRGTNRMTAAADEVLQQLIALDGLDARILRLDKQLQRAPGKLAEREKAVVAIDAKIKLLSDKTQVIRTQIRIKENEYKSVEEKIERMKEQSSELRNNKEFVAFKADLSNAQAECDRLLREVDKMQDVVNLADQKVSTLTGQRDEEALKVEMLRQQTQEKLTSVRDEKEDLLAKRPELLKAVPHEPRAQYERVRIARGRALSALEGNYCSACGEVQTRNDVYAVQNRTRLVPCKTCNRILFVG